MFEELKRQINWCIGQIQCLKDSLFTPALETKLEGIEVGAEKNVQSDWNELDNTDDSFIRNKPLGFLVEYQSKSDFPLDGIDGAIYLDQSTNTLYRWEDKYLEISEKEVHVLKSSILNETVTELYKVDKTDFTKTQKLNLTDKASSIIINDDFIIAGFPDHKKSDNKQYGAVKVYKLSDLSQKGNTIEGAIKGGSFGKQVAISDDGNFIAISDDTHKTRENTTLKDNVGLVVTYKWNGTDWEKYLQNLLGKDENDLFGKNIHIQNFSSHNKLIVVSDKTSTLYLSNPNSWTKSTVQTLGSTGIESAFIKKEEKGYFAITSPTVKKAYLYEVQSVLTRKSLFNINEDNLKRATISVNGDNINLSVSSLTNISTLLYNTKDSTKVEFSNKLSINSDYLIKHKGNKLAVFPNNSDSIYAKNTLYTVLADKLEIINKTKVDYKKINFLEFNNSSVFYANSVLKSNSINYTPQIGKEKHLYYIKEKKELYFWNGEIFVKFSDSKKLNKDVSADNKDKLVQSDNTLVPIVDNLTTTTEGVLSANQGKTLKFQLDTHNHDSRYFTETEVTNKLNAKLNKGTTKDIVLSDNSLIPQSTFKTSDQSLADYYTKGQVWSKTESNSLFASIPQSSIVNTSSDDETLTIDLSTNIYYLGLNHNGIKFSYSNKNHNSRTFETRLIIYSTGNNYVKFPSRTTIYNLTSGTNIFNFSNGPWNVIITKHPASTFVVLISKFSIAEILNPLSLFLSSTRNSVSATASGGTRQYKFRLSTAIYSGSYGGNNKTFSSLSSNTSYTVYVKDSGGNEISRSISTLSAVTPLTLVVSRSTTGMPIGKWKADLTISGGTSPYTISYRGSAVGVSTRLVGTRSIINLLKNDTNNLSRQVNITVKDSALPNNEKTVPVHAL